MVLSTCHTVWKNEKFTVAPKKFRQIDSLVFSLVKTLLSRNFCQKSATVNFRNFHTVPTYQRPLLDFWHGMEQKQRKTIVRYFDTAKLKHKIELVKNRSPLLKLTGSFFLLYLAGNLPIQRSF